MITANQYFFLENFAHRSLWDNSDVPWAPLHFLEKYLKSLKHCIEIDLVSSVYLRYPELITIGEGTIIEPGAMIEGPCIIGKNCKIKHGAYIHRGVLCGNNCIIGHGTEIKRSILLNQVSAAHFVYIGDSIVGNKVNLGAGVKCANLRLDRQDIVVSFDGRRVHTGLKKFGAIIGDLAQIGCNCVLNPGTLLGQSSLVSPLLNFGGTIPPFSRVLGDEKYKITPIIAPLVEAARK